MVVSMVTRMVPCAVAILMMSAPAFAKTCAASDPHAATAAAKASRPLRSLVIVVDPGHGRNPDTGEYTGAEGVNGVSEDHNVLGIANRLAPLLRAQGATVYVSRGIEDPGPPPIDGLIKRVALAERVHADLYISIHENDGTSAQHGLGTYYDTPRSLAFARVVQRVVAAATHLTNLGVYRRPFYVVRNTTMPSVLVEGGYLSNPSEAREISTAAFHETEARALDLAVEDYWAGIGH